MSSPTLLIVDDDELFRHSLTFHLERAGYTVSSQGSAEAALALIEQAAPDLILLDIGLPGMDGLTALAHLSRIAEVPVIFLTARRRELDQVLGLELGAEDYITKPFDLSVLLARIKVVLRRTALGAQPPTPPAPLIVGDLTIDLPAHTAWLAGRALPLRPREFELLHTFAQAPGQLFGVETLLERVWGAGYEGEPQVVYVHVRWLREKIEEEPNRPRRLLTVRGVGYKLVPQEAQDGKLA